MSSAEILIKGIPTKTPKIENDGSISMLFKISSGDKDEAQEKIKEFFCKAVISKDTWRQVSDRISEDTYYVIKGKPRASVNAKSIPFITVLGSSIMTFNNFNVNISSNSIQLKELPDYTEDVIPVSSLIFPQNFQEPTVAKLKALKYLEQHGTLSAPITVKKDTMTIISGHANYLAAKELGIDMVPVAYSKNPIKPNKDDIYLKDINWYMPEEVTLLNIEDIILTEDVHLNTINFTFSLNLKEILEKGAISTPIAVRPIDNNKYSLVIGAARYFACKILNIDKIPAIITDMNHDEFVENRLKAYKLEEKSKVPNEGETLLSLITVPQSFLKTPPRREKVQEMIEYYKKHGKFDKPIVIRGNTNLLIDGYKRYVAAKELNLTSVWTKKFK